VTHYVLSVDVAKLPASLPGKQQLATLPVDMWVDRQGRPVGVAENLDVKGQHVATAVHVGPYNAAVTATRLRPTRSPATDGGRSATASSTPPGRPEAGAASSRA
jgi:hypothetical protein